MSPTADDIIVEMPSFFINQSRWKSFQDCDRLYAWLNIENLIPTQKKGYFEIGSAIHKAQVLAHTGLTVQGKVLAAGSPEIFSVAADIAEADFRKGMGGPKLPGDDEQIQAGVSVIRKMLPAYHAHYAQQGTLWKPLGMELAFCVEVGEGTGVWLVGRIDNLVTFLNSLWLVDYKTMAKLDMREFMKYEIDVQLTAYIYGGTKQLSLDAISRGEKPVIIRGAIIDGMVKTQIPQFHREMYTRTIDDLREFELEFCMKVWEIHSKHALLNNDRRTFDLLRDKMWDLGRSAGWKVIFPKNTQRCFGYGTCSHRTLCVKDNEIRRMEYKKRDPDYVDEARAASSRALSLMAIRSADVTGEPPAGAAGDQKVGD